MAARKGEKKRAVVVIGGGIAGVTVADRLGRAGATVHLIEREATIGGHAARTGCKATDTCLHCNACLADEMFRSVRTAPNVSIHLGTEIAELRDGTAGTRFRAVLRSPGQKGRSSRARTVAADAVVVATGFEPFQPAENSSYGVGRIPNVITGIEAEHQLSETNTITRPSDGKRANRIAFIQCVGSRTEEKFRRPEDTDYCSAVCCSYALRMGRRLQHEAEDAKITVFYMDIQNFGKGFHEFYAECRDRMRFIRSRPYELNPGRDGAVLVTYTPEAGEGNGDGEVREEAFDLVILSVGIRPPTDARLLADRLGVALDENGFFGLKGASAFPDLQRAGIHVVGACEGPKDIAGCVAQAEAVSGVILRDLGIKPGMSRKPNNLAQRSVYRELPEPTKAGRKAVQSDVVVAGGGTAGLQAAVSLAALGHRVTLVHKDAELGGVAAAVPELYGHVDAVVGDAGETVGAAVAGLAAAARSARNVTVQPSTRVTRVQGELGNFEVTVSKGGGKRSIRAGAVVLACGSVSGSVGDAALATGGAVVDMKGLMARIRGGQVPGRVAILMDLTREQGRAVSAQALSAADLLCRRFDSEVKVFCSSVRVAAAGMERLYRRARDAGTVVVKAAEKPVVSGNDGTASVTFEDPVAGLRVREEFDLVVKADLTPAVNGPGGLPEVRNLKRGPAGVLQYDDVWLQTGLTSRPGVFVVGEARGNSDYRDARTDGLAVAAEIHALLGTRRIRVGDDAAEVDADKCVLCLTCVRVCPHGAITIDEARKAASISAVSCQRCGICAAECPAQAITLPRFTDEEIEDQIGSKPRLTVFACENSAMRAAETAALKLSAKVKLIPVPCAGKVDPRSVLTALERGADKVLILGCHPESCQYLQGASRASRRFERIGTMLEKAGFDRERVQFRGISSVEPGKFAAYMDTR